MSFIKTRYSTSVCESDLEIVFSGCELFVFFCVYFSPFLYCYGLFPSLSLQQMSRVIRKPVFAYTKTKVQISCAVTEQLISAEILIVFSAYSSPLYYGFYLSLSLQQIIQESTKLWLLPQGHLTYFLLNSKGWLVG